jgi:hypothetical protein
MNGRAFSFGRFWAIVAKEFIQMRRDRITLGMMLGIPLTQLILFGYAINSDPRHSAHGCFVRGQFGFFPVHRRINADQQLLSCGSAGRKPCRCARNASKGNRSVRSDHPRAFRPTDRSRRTPGPAAGGRRHGPVRFQQRGGRFSRNRTKGPATGSERPAFAPGSRWIFPWTSVFTPSITLKPFLSTISFPASWALF